VGVAADVVALLHHQAGPAQLRAEPLGDRQARETRADDQVVELPGHGVSAGM